MLQIIILAVVLFDTADAVSSSTSSAVLETIVTTVAAVIGAAVVVGLIKQQSGDSSSSRGSSSRHKKNRSVDETASSVTDISVEGSVMVTLPTWALASWEDYFTRKYTTDEQMMSLAIHLSDRNITEGTGGPFGAAIFERHADNHTTLVSIGMNRVIPLGNSTLHGETVAIQLAQRRLGSFTLMLDENMDQDGLFYDESQDEQDEKGSNPPRKRRFELFTSCEPCAMCLGATLWSGVSRIVCAATKDDAQAIGFDEGPVFEQSYEHLEKAGIQVTRNVLRKDAAKVLRRYGTSGIIYNR
jgi:tRNA(Arg) A34 adenosine deaminase TadA